MLKQQGEYNTKNHELQNCHMYDQRTTYHNTPTPSPKSLSAHTVKQEFLAKTRETLIKERNIYLANQIIHTASSGIKWLLLYPKQYRILLFADANQIIGRHKSPNKYESKEPGCLHAWNNMQIEHIKHLADKNHDHTFISLNFYLDTHRWVTKDVRNLYCESKPGELRDITHTFTFCNHYCTLKGLRSAIHFQHALACEHFNLRGWNHNTYLFQTKLPNQEWTPASDYFLLNKDGFIPSACEDDTYYSFTQLRQRYRPLLGIRSLAQFHQHRFKECTTELLNRLNDRLNAIFWGNFSKQERLHQTLLVISEYLPRLQQIHITTDGSSRTNIAVINYIMISFGYPPFTFWNPNHTNMVDSYDCYQQLLAALNNSCILIASSKKSTDALAEFMPAFEAINKNRTSHHTKQRAIGTGELSEAYISQGLKLTETLNNFLDTLDDQNK
ncbi:hypothetical protein [Kistimonas asteriae]|uniref:hypothetical protein n=1 Tax=Kistimonas asteriae TaxID=517724 RepID=UPI001BA6BABD|nr:hypothetical protein [Kistimonas asteriae]